MKKSDTSSKTAHMTPNTLETWPAANVTNLSDFGSAWFDGIADLGSNVLNFTAARVAQDVQIGHELMSAKDVTQFQHVQAQYVQCALDDYAAQAAKLMKISKAFMAS